MNEREDVIRRLRTYRDDIQAAIDLIGNKRTLTPAERDEIRGRFSSLKERLRADRDAGATVRGEAELNETERRYFQPAVMRAAVSLSAAVNTNPLTSDWFGQLYSARMDINQFLLQLEPLAEAG